MGTVSASAAAGVLIAAVLLLVDGITVTFDFVNWDDDLYVLQNPLLLEPADRPLHEHLLTPALGYPIPVTIGTFQLNRLAGGFDPFGYHLVNVLLHVAAALALFQLMRRIGLATLASMIAALLFGLHPLTAEVVSWVTDRKELLATLFALVSLASLDRARREQRRTLLALCSIAFIASLLSKPSAIALPALFFYWDRTRHRRGLRDSLLPTLPLACAAVAVSALALAMEAAVGAYDTTMSLAQRIERIGETGLWHARVVLWPVDLLPIYRGDAASAAHWLSLALQLAVGTGLLAIVFSRRFRGTPLAFGSLLFLLGYLPVSGLLPLNRRFADSYLYLPLCGLSIMVGSALQSAQLPRLRRASRAGVVVVLVAFLPLRLQASMHWEDGVALWSATEARHPSSKRVCRNLGNAYMFGRRFADDPAASSRRAVHQFRRCLQRFGDQRFFAKNLGIALFGAGLFERSRVAFEIHRDHTPDDQVTIRYLKRIAALSPRRSRAGGPVPPPPAIPWIDRPTSHPVP